MQALVQGRRLLRESSMARLFPDPPRTEETDLRVRGRRREVRSPATGAAGSQ